jgi:predicted Zn-ribbon and HTH transcriptional regulator
MLLLVIHLNIFLIRHKLNIVMAKMIKIDGWRCERCDHEWAPRKKAEKPRVCPKCKSPYWDTPRAETQKPK